jgi:hypothetical protein
MRGPPSNIGNYTVPVAGKMTLLSKHPHRTIVIVLLAALPTARAAAQTPTQIVDRASPTAFRSRC